MQKLFYILLFMLVSSIGFTQIELDRVLIGSGFSEFDNGIDFTLSASVGEVMIQTVETTDLIITQGFQQSNYILSSPLIADLVATKAACFGANDGSISVGFISDQITEPYIYQWSNGGTEPTLTQLEAGTYTVTITGSNGNSVTNSAIVGATDSVDCAPGFYTGITPNGDNFNDYWQVDNAEFFTKKEVQIFNRYGTLIWETQSYSNIDGPFVGAHSNGKELPDGTYFYVARFDDSVYRGWIEISR